MSDIRTEWIATMEKYWLSPDRPDNERFWCTQLDTAPQEELRALQSEKLLCWLLDTSVPKRRK